MRITLALLLLVFALGCDEPQQQKNFYSPNDFALVGLHHNEGMQQLFLTLKNKKEESGQTITKDQWIRISENETRALADREGLSSELNQVAHQEITKVFDKYFSANNLAARSKMLEASLYTDEEGNILSAKQRELLDALDVVLMDEDEYMPSLHSRISLIESRALYELSPEEQIVIFSGTSLARATLDYWYVNYPIWRETFSGDASISRTQDFSWKQTGKVDVASAVGAATGCGVSYLLGAGPVGWKAWAAIVGGAAVGGSVTDAILQLW